jgi:uncharacterized protein
MATHTQSPADHIIPIRNIQFNRDPGLHPRWWHSGDPVPTAFFNALSCTFPEGEKFFMDSVRHYRDQVPSDLRAEIKQFIGQEAVHSREHAAFNDLATHSGYDVTPLEARAKRYLGFGRKRSRIEQLAATAALEHFTAILAHALLASDSRDMQGAPDDAVRLWTWHAMEEIEHKAVSYDTFLYMTRSWWPVRRYLLRVRAMILGTILLFLAIGGNMGDSYRQDGVRNLRTWLRTIGYLLGSPGILRRIALPYLDYFRPGFHPWQHDDRALLSTAKRILAMPAAA